MTMRNVLESALSGALALAMVFAFSGLVAPSNAGAAKLEANNSQESQMSDDEFDEADEDEDGYISTAEGVPFYGSVQLSLTTEGDMSPDSALALDRFPAADDDGNLEYDETFEVSDEIMDAIMDEEVAIVQHGIDINGNGEYDGEKESSLDEDVPFEATVPASCGIVEEEDDDEFMAELEELNSSGATADVTIEIVDEDDNEIRVMISSEGLSADLPHAQHFHFGTEGECPPNTEGVDQDMDDDEDREGEIEEEEDDNASSSDDEMDEDVATDAELQAMLDVAREALLELARVLGAQDTTPSFPNTGDGSVN